MDDSRQYGCAVTSEMCQLKALATTKELGIMGFKATLRLCQVAGADLSSSGDQRGMALAYQAYHPHTTMASTCMRLTVVTMYVKIDVFLQANLYFS